MFSAYAVLNPGPSAFRPLKASWLQPPSVITPVSSSTTPVSLGWAKLLDPSAAIARAENALREILLISIPRRGPADAPAKRAESDIDRRLRLRSRPPRARQSGSTNNSAARGTRPVPTRQESKKSVGRDHA